MEHTHEKKKDITSHTTHRKKTIMKPAEREKKKKAYTFPIILHAGQTHTEHH